MDRPSSLTRRPRSSWPIDDGLREVIVVKDVAPPLKRSVGGEDHRPLAPVPLVDDMEEHVGRIGPVGEVADLIDDSTDACRSGGRAQARRRASLHDTNCQKGPQHRLRERPAADVHQTVAFSHSAPLPRREAKYRTRSRRKRPATVPRDCPCILPARP